MTNPTNQASGVAEPDDERALSAEQFRYTDGNFTLKQDVIHTIHAYADTKPENDPDDPESWESWFEAAFDLCSSRIADIFDEHERRAAALAAKPAAPAEVVATVWQIDDEHGGIAWQTSAPTEAHAASIARRNGKVTPLAPVAALRTPAQAPSTGATRVVPLKPTKAMQDAWDSAPSSEDSDADFAGAYQAMLDAAPPVVQPASPAVEVAGEKSVLAALRAELQGAANYIDVLGGDSKKYRIALATTSTAAQPESGVEP